MLKLLKYDFKYYINKLWILYIGAFILSLTTFFTAYFNDNLLTGFIFDPSRDNTMLGFSPLLSESDIVEGIGNSNAGIAIIILITIIWFMLFALAITSIVYVEKRFKTNILGEEAYLTMTLPVRTESIIGSKLISGTVLIIFNCIFAVLIAAIALGGIIMKSIDKLLDYLKYIDFGIEEIMMIGKVFLIILTIFVLFQTATSFISTLATIPIFGKHKKIIEGLLTVVIIIGYIKIPDIISEYTFFSGIGTVVNIILSILFFLGTNYILKNKLNIE